MKNKRSLFYKIFKKIILIIFSSLPLSHFYKIKAKLLNLLNFHIEESARLVSSVKFLGVENVFIGKDTYIGEETMIIGPNQTTVKIGSYCDISSRVIIVTGSHEIDINGKHIAGKGIGKDIIIEDGVWIGINATILPGVKIGKNSIIAAGSVVIRDVPPKVMVAGNPAEIKKKLD